MCPSPHPQEEMGIGMAGKICLAKEKMEPSTFFRTFGAHTDLHYAEEGGALSRHRSGNEG